MRFYKRVIYVFSLLLLANLSFAQLSMKSFKSDFTKKARRESFKNYLLEKNIKETFRGPLNHTTTHQFEDACLSVTQFLIRNSDVENGFNKLFEAYFRQPVSLRQAFLSSVYATYPKKYAEEIKKILPFERDPKVFSIAAVYLFRHDTSAQNVNYLVTQTNRQFANSDTLPILVELKKYLTRFQWQKKQKTPDINQLFIYQRLYGRKTVYSFQRWNRDYNGIAIIQNKDGSFAKDENGKVLMIEQLARSGSDLPYFITNGSTPQGIYSIAGVGHSINNLIGPTTNLQSVIPYQNEYLFWRGMPYDSTAGTYTNYQRLLPPSWQSYAPMYESYYAGLIGRRYIIVHGTTLDPAFFKDESFYPNAPTDGCLSGTEIWADDGTLQRSEQFRLANAFVSTPDSTGLLIVVNIDNKNKAVTREEIQMYIDVFEGRLAKPAGARLEASDIPKPKSLQ
ncbi:hypothetical protein ACFSPU_09525 [Haoranjiania flava]|uniref:Uncharacterized protein n=1 Tax=Haoranjiania flava TaxID=1856322 RepID=A0AAE3ILV9_9BACT|nr:hypothetical protein [Haoranjiania flava]MCU7693335.1 hypothetical protein [Haoranjiania flava]